MSRALVLACLLAIKHNVNTVFGLRLVYVVPVLLLPKLSALNSRLISLQNENAEINPAWYWQQHSTVVLFSL